MKRTAAAPRTSPHHPGPRAGVCWLVSAVLVSAINAGQAAAAAEGAPVRVQSAPGRFEVSARDATLAHCVAAAAEEAWRTLTGPLVLPDSFPSPIIVRLITAAESAADQVPFRVAVEAGGLVSVRVRTDVPAPVLRRALVQALIMRLAVAQHGVTQWLTAPLWLEHACVDGWTTRAAPAQLDA